MGTTPTSSLFFLMLCVPMALAMANPAEKLAYPYPCECPKENETRMQMYLHQFRAWQNVSNPNEILAIDFTSHLPLGFGTTYVHDWILTIGPNPNENIVARAQGFHIQAGQTATSCFPGSTLEVLGVIASGTGQWSIMGGTGAFTNAHGIINFKSVPSTVSSITDNVRELDIHIFYTPETSTA
ncbi:hypothetical protein BS78_01G248300, partial [Paspalum vaginatum]